MVLLPLTSQLCLVAISLFSASFIKCQVRANEIYLEANLQLGVRDKDVLMNADSPHQWWSTLKSAVFGSSSSLPPLVGGGGGLVCESVGKADLLSCNFESATHAPSVSLSYYLCRQVEREVRRFLLDMDPSGSFDPCVTWILGVVSKQLTLLHGRVGDSTTSVNSLIPQMSDEW